MLQAGTGFPLGNDLLPLIAALGTNRSLTDLDVRDNATGNRGAILLAQVLKMITQLQSLLILN